MPTDLGNNVGSFLIKARVQLCLSVMFAIMALCYNPVIAADNGDNVDVPASESSEAESVPDDKAAPEDIKEPQNPTPEKPASTDNNTPAPNMLVLQGLNKVVGRVSTLEVPLGALIRFENLEIIARKCWKSEPDEHTENASLLEIREVKTNEEPKQIFLGWMFSSSPSISGLEHPVYDVTVLSCEYRKDLEVN